MKYVPKSSALKFQNSDSVDVLEYSMGDKDIDAAVATINGKYPDNGFVVNEECKELLYVISGEGKVIAKGQTVDVKPGDQVLIDKDELFRYEDCKDLVLLAACNPAWTPKQHKKVEA